MFTKREGTKRIHPLYTRLNPEAKATLDAAVAEFQQSSTEVINELLGDLNAVRAVLAGDVGALPRAIEAAAKVERAVRPPGKRPIGRAVAGAKAIAKKRRATTWAQKIGKAKVRRG